MHSYNKIWIHAIWATKYRAPILNLEIEKKVHNFIAKKFIELGCQILIVNGMPDHIHCLFKINPNKSSVEVIKGIKGSTTSFINQNKLLKNKFAWQNGYACFSVSKYAVNTVYRYIKNQKQHHSKKSYDQEISDCIKFYETQG